MKAKILIIFILTVFFLSASACNYEKIAKGNEIAAKIEKFRVEKGKLPESLNEVGVAETEEGPVYYQKKSDSKYILWFGTSLGESKAYDSETKQWNDFFPPH